MANKPDEGFCIYGVEVISRYLQALKAELEGVRLAQDIEYIHRMRVASRRLRSALPLFEACFPQKRYSYWIKHIRKVTRSLGAARDMDVQLEELNKFFEEDASPAYKAGLLRLKLRLSQQRAVAQEKIITTLDAIDQEGVLTDLEDYLAPSLARSNLTYPYTPFVYQKSYESIATRVEELLSYEPYVDHPEAVTELHAMRIAAKRLRYTMEIFAPIYPGELKSYLQTVRKIQDMLGELHDADVWIAFLPDFLQKERAFTQEYYGHTRTFHRLIAGIEAFLVDRQAARQEHYQDFVQLWRKSASQNTWDSLLTATRIPYFQGESHGTAQDQVPPSPASEQIG